MAPSRRTSRNNVYFNTHDEQQSFTGLTMLTPPPSLTRGSSISAIFNDSRRCREGRTIKQSQSSIRRVWAKYEVPYVIGEEVRERKRSLCERILIIGAWCLLVIFFPFSLFFTLKIVQEYERAVIFRLGRLSNKSARGPGMCFILPCIDIIHLVDMRTVSFDVPPQEVLTRDSVTVAVDAVVYYRVFNPTVSVANVEYAQESTRLLAQTSLRNVLGTRLLSELLSDRGAVSKDMRECLDDATDNWGIKVERVEIKDVRLPKMLQRIMAAEAEAAREARAKIIVSEGEFKASRALKEAADILSQSPFAMQLRYLQTLSSIATEQNSTIIFPLPLDFLPLFQKFQVDSQPFLINTSQQNQINYRRNNSLIKISYRYLKHVYVVLFVVVSYFNIKNIFCLSAMNNIKLN